MVNRTQALVLGFTVLALVSLVGTLVAAPEVYDRAMRPPSRDGPLEIAFLVALAAFIALLGVGVLRRDGAGPSGWSWWPVTAAPASGEPSNRSRAVSVAAEPSNKSVA